MAQCSGIAAKWITPAAPEATTAAATTVSPSPRSGRALMQGLRGHRPGGLASTMLEELTAVLTDTSSNLDFKQPCGPGPSGRRPQWRPPGSRRTPLPAEPAHGGQVGEAPGPERHPGAEDRR